MASPLGTIYSRADALKRQLYDMLTNPRDAAAMLGGRIVESGQQAQALQEQTFADPNRPFRVTDPQAMARLTDMLMAGPMGFAPGGMIKPEIAAKVLPQTKIVDEAGNPQLMYHGTREDFEEFSPGSRGAIFATPENEEFLQPYLGRFFNTKTGNFEFASGANVRPVYINAKNPFDYENPSHVDKLMKVLGKSDPEFFAETTVGRQLKRRLEQGNWEEIETRDVQKAIKKLGFDGFYVNEGNVKNIAVFDPKQIRSATSDPQMSSLLD
jgi:hypothetical protein